MQLLAQPDMWSGAEAHTIRAQFDIAYNTGPGVVVLLHLVQAYRKPSLENDQAY